MNGIDWPVLMQAGFQRLGLRPDQFWALTPAELTLMLGRAAGQQPLSRSRLAELAAAYPDMNEGDRDERDGPGKP